MTTMVLSDLLGPGLDLIIVGTAAGRASAKRGLYYAGRGNRFWRILHEVGLTPIELKADDYRHLIEYRIGLTDLAKHASGMDQDLPANCFDPARLRRAIEALSPTILAFNGKKAAGVFFGVATAKVTYGQQKGRIGRTTIYVCPQTSAANADWSADPWHKLARDLRALRVL
jgi:TDG/mug DNA glycosylase family protein